ncbi:hypothetical protein [Desulforamulus profundi]|uniref:hypothetical protein n=1 Tax=Desulforamulus profundi TaxID=1383067 RepID=UPI001EE5E9CD|nr:hypothetical protein [Desulforamulus profundi]
MIIGLSDTAFEYRGTIQDIIWLFYPGAELVAGPKGEFFLHLTLRQEGQLLWAETQLYSNGTAMAHRRRACPSCPGKLPMN